MKTTEKAAILRLGIGAIVFLGGVAAAVAQPARYDRAADQHPHVVFMREGGWCWFQDPRAIIHDGKLCLGSVQGHGSGPALVGVYDLQQEKSLGNRPLQDNFRHDDHNSPVFYARPDGRVLAVYALHGNNYTHYFRISRGNDLLEWGEEMTYEHKYPRAGTVTYMNLLPMAEEGKLYNFFRGIDFNPCFITSTDQGKTWGEPTHFIADELKGRHRPYARYVSNGVDTVHVCFTDGHPDRFGNSIYYAAFRNGDFYRADGTLIKNLEKDGPLQPSEAEELFRGSRTWAPDGPASADRSAWTSTIVLGSNGSPHVGYSLHISDTDHRYRMAFWNGARWIDREVAHAGHCLYASQTSYTGLITLDPGDPSTVLISTNVDPSTGAKNGGRHEIYRAKVGPEDDIESIQWTAVTKHSPVSNIRPAIVRGDGFRVCVWLRGDYRDYTNYQVDVVGSVEQIE